MSRAHVTLGGRPERGRSTSPWVPWLAKRYTHFRKAEYVNWSASETCLEAVPFDDFAYGLGTPEHPGLLGLFQERV